MASDELTPVYQVRPFKEDDRDWFHAFVEHQGNAALLRPEETVPECDARGNLSLTLTRDGEPVAFGYGIATGELALVVDRISTSPAERWRFVQDLLEAARAVAYGVVKELHLFIPPELARYADRLETLPGITRPDTIHLVLAVGPPLPRPASEATQ